jgi:peptidyl-prolyl cis-trans isomerase B (cyclophilin B)
MAKRERYTERTRPHRKKAGGSQQGGRSDGLDNPIVLVAVGGLLLAVVLALGVFFGRQTLGGSSADSPDAGATTVVVADADQGEPDQGDAAQGDEGDAVVGDEAGQEDADAVDDAGSEDKGDETAAGDSSLFLPGDGNPYQQPDDMGLTPGEKAYFATIETDKGDILVELWPEIAPAHVNAFAFLASEGFYDGLTFHRVEDWVVQGGDPTGTGGGGPGYNLPAEFNADDPVPHSYGTFAMARTSDPNTGGSQFYFIKDPAGASFLDRSYTVFGHVVSGMDVVEQIAIGDVMSKVTFEEKDISERMVSPDDIRAGNLPEQPGSAE